MPMNDKQKELLQVFLRKKIAPPTVCPICHGQNWNFADTIWELREFSGGTLRVGGPVFPVLSMTCSTCGHTLFINALVAGILEPSKEQGQ